MRNRPLVSIALVAASVVALASRPALACSCVPGTDQQHFAAATLVFVGVATAVEDPRSNEDQRSTADPLRWTFIVEQVQKGTVGDRTTIESPRGSPTCGFEFVVGSRYQLFAAGDPPSTTICSGTRALVGTALPYEPSPPTALIVGAVLGALLLVWSFRRVRDMRVPIDPGPPAPMD